MSTITVTRRSGGLVDRARKYKVLIDGSEAGRIGAGESQSFAVKPGSHEVTLSMDRARSEPVHVEVTDGQTAGLYCEPASMLTTTKKITLRPA